MSSRRQGALPQQHRVLVAAGNPAVREQLAAQLPDRYGRSGAASGQEALAKLGGEEFWLMLVDDSLPDVDPLQLIRKAKAYCPETRVIFCAAHGTFLRAEEAMELGADALLSLPCRETDLLRKLDWLERHSRPVTTARGDERMQRLERYIEAHLAKPLGQEELLEVACLSRSALYRYVRKQVGVSCAQYIKSKRLEKARFLLEHGEGSVREVAAAVGFQDVGYFCRWFKQSTTRSPLAFRRMHRKGKESLMIAALVPLSGAYGDLGADVLLGTDFAAAEVARRSGIELEIYPIDTETDPAAAARKAWEAVQRRGIRYFTGCASSAEAAEVSRVMEETHSLLITSAGVCPGRRELNQHVFRWSLPTVDAVRKTIIPLASRSPTARRWFTVTPDYIFGHTLLNHAAAVFRETDLHHVGNAFHAMGSRDFRPLFEKARAVHADVIVLLNYGGDTVAALRQAREMGLGQERLLLAPWSNGLTDILNIGPECARGVYFGTQYWQGADVPANNLLRNSWGKRFGVDPSYTSVTGYIGVMLLHMAIQKTGSCDPDRNLRALESLEWDGLTAIREFINPSTHQTRKGYFLLRGSDVAGGAELLSV